MTVHCPRLCCSNPCVVEYSSYEMFSLFEMRGISFIGRDVQGSQQLCGVYFARVASISGNCLF